MQNKLISIGETAKRLGVSIDTLRRWDKAGRLKATRGSTKSHRHYLESDLAQFVENIEVVSKEWAQAQKGFEPQPDMYCQTRDVFQARLESFQAKLGSILPIEKAALITAIAGEIGNNSFDHNLGNWPDIPGVFFAYSLRERKVVLADRGLGILATLRHVRPQLSTAEEALQVAFTETISGRYPETRGNGLKFVKAIITKNPLTLSFQTGDAYLFLEGNTGSVNVEKLSTTIRGCFAIIGFEEAV